jgi:hypothetical protein
MAEKKRPLIQANPWPLFGPTLISLYAKTARQMKAARIEWWNVPQSFLRG